jgi:hypothetical protein
MTSSSDEAAEKPREIIDRKTASEIMKVPIRTLENWQNADPPFGPGSWAINNRGDRRYYRDECEQWAKDHPR